jgi:acyl carrier protein
MDTHTADAARELILDHVAEQLAAKGLTPSDVPPSFDLLLEGAIDSFGIVELITMLEERFAFEFDFDEIEADDLTRVGPLTDYVGRKARAS